MAEPQKKDSSSVKEKNSLLDLDIGNDFLSNWKSMSMEGDDMDFDLTPAPKGNKKSFNFDKADMNFNLDGDFGKMSSFNMDMSDLDISPPLKKDGNSKEKSKESSGKMSSFNMDMSDLDISPPFKKDGKTKDKSKEPSSGKDKGKADCFAFAFDFDEMENFSFEPSLPKEGSKAQKDKDSKEGSPSGSAGQENKDSPSGSGCGDKEGSTNMNIIGNMSTVRDCPQKPSFNMDCLGGEIADFVPTRKTCPSKLATDDAVSSKPSAATDEVASNKAKTPPETTTPSRELQRTNQYEQLIPSKPVDLEAFSGKNAMQEFTSDFVSNNEPSGANSSEALDKVDHVDKITISNVEQDVNVHSVAGSTRNYKHTVTENLQKFQTVAISEKNNSEKSQGGVEGHVIDNEESTDPVSSLVENSCITSTVSGMLSDITSSIENRELASDTLKLPLVSQPVDHLSSEKELENRREPLVTLSRNVIQSEKPKCPVQKASTQATVSSLSSKKVGFTQPSLVEGRRDLTSIQSERKLASLPLQHSTKQLRKELPQFKTQESSKGLKISGEVSSSDGLQNGKKLNDCPTTQNKDMVQETAVREREMSMKDVDNFREVCNVNGLKNEKKLSDSSTTQNNDMVERTALRQRETSMKDVAILSSSMKINKNTARNSEHPTTLASLPTIKSTPVSVGGGKKTPDLGGLKLSTLNIDSTKSPIRKDVKSVGNISQNTVLLRNTASSAARFADTQKQTPSTLSMKRKASESYAAADISILHPSKRPFQSPTANRSLMETSEKVLGKKVQHHNKMEDDRIKSTFGSPQFSTYDIPHEVRFNEVEISFSIENDSSIRQGEAYSKELDDLCNMLRKKQEEAKEILVKAIVNSNKLLMLNSPLIEAKIRATRDIFARLTLGNVHG